MLLYNTNVQSEKVLLKSLDCGTCLSSDGSNPSLSRCERGDDGLYWTLKPCDNIDTWFQVENYQDGECLLSNESCNEVTMGDCTEDKKVNPNSIWAYVGGHLYSYTCFANPLSDSSNSVLDAWCGGDDVDISSFGDVEDRTFIALPVFDSGSSKSKKGLETNECADGSATCNAGATCVDTPGAAGVGYQCDNACFPPGSTVSVVSGDDYVEAPIEDLKLGDEVKCISQTSRGISNCTVFFHYHPSNNQTFAATHNIPYIKFTYGTDEEDFVVISPDHLMYRLNEDKVGEVFSTIPDFTANHIEFPPAIDFSVGDVIAIEDGSSLRAVSILSAETLIIDGAYAPFVSDGGMPIVNSVVTSSFVDIRQNDPGTMHYEKSARISAYFYSKIEDGTIEKPSVWGLTRDDPDYIAWEVDNYFSFLFKSSPTGYYRAVRNVRKTHTLTKENAIHFNKVVLAEVAAGIMTDQRMVDLIGMAYTGTLPEII